MSPLVALGFVMSEMLLILITIVDISRESTMGFQLVENRIMRY